MLLTRVSIVTIILLFIASLQLVERLTGLIDAYCKWKDMEERRDELMEKWEEHEVQLSLLK